MAFFKRPEVWVLLLLSAAGIAWVLWSDDARDRAADEEAIAKAPSVDEPGEAAEKRYALRGRRVSREEDHLILTLRISRTGASATGEPLELNEPAVRLETDDGAAVSRFFLPADPPPFLSSESGAFADLRYWMPLSQIGGALWLEIDGDRLAVKEAGTPETEFPDGIEIAVNGLDWLP